MGDEEAEVVPHCKQLVSIPCNSPVRRKRARDRARCCMALLPDYRATVDESAMPLCRSTIDIASVSTPASSPAVDTGYGAASDGSKQRASPSPILPQQKRYRHRQQHEPQRPEPPSQGFSPWPYPIKPDPQPESQPDPQPKADVAENQKLCESPTHAQSNTKTAACPPPPSKPARKPRNLLHSSSSACRKKKFFIPSNLDELPPALQSLFA